MSILSAILASVTLLPSPTSRDILSWGPAVVRGNEIVLKDVPKKLKGPIDIVVVTYDLARQETPVMTTYRLTRTNMVK